MKKIVIVVIIIVLLLGVFVRRNVIVLNKSNGKAVPFVEILFPTGVVKTDSNGTARFVTSVFQRNIKLKRIGFDEKGVKLPFRFFYSKSKFFLEQANYSVIKEQINSAVKKMHSYSYSYSLTSKGESENVGSQTILASYDNGDFLFENKSDFTKVHYKVLYKNKKLYLFKDGKFILLSGSDKDEFTAKNIIFIPLEDFITSFLLDSDPSTISVDGDMISITWNNGSGETDLTVTVDKNDFPVKFTLYNKSGNGVYNASLVINRINERISIGK